MVLAAGVGLRWGQTTNVAPSTRRHRASQAPRTEAHSNTREVYTMVLAHSPNGGDGEPEVTMGATDAGAARLKLMARDVPPTRDPRGCLLPAAERPLLRDRVARVVIRLLLALFFRVQVEGRERIPMGRPLICAANHHSWLDPFLLLTILPLAPRRYAIGIPPVSPAWRRIITPFHTFIPLDRAPTGRDPCDGGHPRAWQHAH